MDDRGLKYSTDFTDIPLGSSAASKLVQRIGRITQLTRPIASLDLRRGFVQDVKTLSDSRTAQSATGRTNQRTSRLYQDRSREPITTGRLAVWHRERRVKSRSYHRRADGEMKFFQLLRSTAPITTLQYPASLASQSAAPVSRSLSREQSTRRVLLADSIHSDAAVIADLRAENATLREQMQACRAQLASFAARLNQSLPVPAQHRPSVATPPQPAPSPSLHSRAAPST